MATNLRISGTHSTPRSTSDIRINYWDLRKIIAASNAFDNAGNQAQFYSSNGGATWRQTTLPLVHGDDEHSGPAVDWTSDGTGWALTTGIQNSSGEGRIRCYKSIDGGATWKFDSTVSGTQTDADTALMWVDHSPTSPHKNNMYATWCECPPSDSFSADGPAFVSRRAGPDGTWEVPIQIGGAAVLNDITTNSVGDVFAFSADFEQSLYVAKSADGGASFGKPVVIATRILLLGLGRIVIPAVGPPQENGEVGLLVGISGGAFRDGANDLVYSVWFDLNDAADAAASGGGPFTDATSPCKSRIWFSRSTDGGRRWEAARKINDQIAKNDQFNPRMVVDETTGEIMVIYYDTINDPKRIKTDVWMQHSPDHGETWTRAVQISTGATDETEGGADLVDQYGWYNGLTGHSGSFFLSWTDRRDGAREEIWTAPLGPNPGVGLAGNVGDFDGDGADELFVSSPWGIGILKKSGDALTSVMVAANGSRLGEWLLDTDNTQFGPVADFDNDGRDEILVRSPWGIGVLKYHHGALTAVGLIANGAVLGAGTLNALQDTFLPISSPVGNGSLNLGLFYRNSLGVMVIALMSDGSWDTGGIFRPWGSSIDAWTLGADDNFGPIADFDGDGLYEILVTSDWGIGVIKIDGWQTLITVENGTSLPGGWTIDTSNNNFFLAGTYEYNPASLAVLLVTSTWGVATLILLRGDPRPGDPTTPISLETAWIAANGTHLGGWTLDTFTNRFGPTAAYINPGPAPTNLPSIGASGWVPSTQILVESPSGIGILGPGGYAGIISLTAVATARNGSNIGNWTLDGTNSFVAAGKFGGGYQDELLVTSPWGIGLLKLPSSYEPFAPGSHLLTTTFSCPLLQANGTRLGEWVLETNVDQF